MRGLHAVLPIWFLVAACDGHVVDVHDPASLGAAFVDQRGCRNCHGGNLAGSTKPRAGTQAYPANLTSEPGTGLGDWADLQIVRAVRFGIDDQGRSLCPPMPHFDAMSDLEADSIVAFLRTLAPVKHAIPDSDCPPPDGGADD